MSAWGPEWDQVLRGLVYEAYDAKGTDDWESKVAAIVEAWSLWPLAEAEMYLDHARERLLRINAEIEDSERAWYADVFAKFDERRLDQMAGKYVEVARAA